MDENYLKLVEQVFTMARLQAVNANPGDKGFLNQLLQLELDLMSKLEEYKNLKQSEEMLEKVD